MRIGKKYLLSLCAFAAVLCCSCAGQLEDDGPSAHEMMDLEVTLRLDQSALLKPFTRVSSSAGKECEINDITLLITKVIGRQEMFDSYQTLEHPDISQKLKFELPVETGVVKRFYLVANINPAILSSFTGADMVCQVPDKYRSDFYSNADYAMQIDKLTGEGSDIMMSACVLKDDSKDILIQGGSVSIEQPVELTRVVSKVLLTCTEDPLKKGYVKIADDIGGWVKFENMRYLLNTFDKKFYLFPHQDPLQGLYDLNYNMSSFVDNKCEILDNLVYNANFQAYDIEDIMYKLNEDKVESFFQALPFDNDRTYTEGIYCLENRVHDDLTYTERPQNFLQANKKLTTHLIAAAKYIPQKVYRVKTEKDQKYLELFTAADEQEMLQVLTGQKEVVGTMEHTYSAGTFWYYNNQYFTLDAMKFYLDTRDDIHTEDIMRFDSGWGFYGTFIDGKPNPQTGIVDYSEEKTWGLNRNNHYILKLNKLTPPGSPVPGVKIMLVPVIQPWKNKDVDLEVTVSSL